MARTVEQISKVIFDSFIGTPLESKLTSTSKVSLYRLFAYTVAYCIQTLENVFDTHLINVNNSLSNLKVHRLGWYKQKALDFQYGFDLITDTDKYDNTGFTQTQIDNSKIIKYVAASEAVGESRLIIKIATDNGTDLAPISEGEKDALEAYFAEVKDAGVQITILNNSADRLYPYIRIFYDPLVLDEEGNSIIAGGKPVETAIAELLKTLPFDGALSVIALVDALQVMPGVVIPQVDQLTVSWFDSDLLDYGTPVAIDVKKVPESGYFKIQTFEFITYIPSV